MKGGKNEAKEPLRVLLVEDDQSISSMLIAILNMTLSERFDLDIKLFKRGNEAIEFIANLERRIDFVITDFHLLDEIDGADIALTVLTHRQGVTIVGMSAHIKLFEKKLNKLEVTYFSAEKVHEEFDTFSFRGVYLIHKPLSSMEATMVFLENILT